MRKTFSFIITMLAMLFAYCSFSMFSLNDEAYKSAYASSLSDNAIITLSGESNEQGIVVKAFLRQNTGLNGMTLEISYDNSMMQLRNLERGEALSTLDYMTTNIHTEQGYAITPFKINYSGDKNDDSTGLLFVMEFKINESVVDGEYLVTLKSDKSTVSYVDEGMKTKSALIDGVKIYIKGNSVEKIVEETPNNDNTTLIVIIAASSGALVLAAGIGAFVFFKSKGKKAWTKVN